jgi:hypothetical protein
MKASWNLLNFPSLHQQRRRRHRVITTLVGLALGALLAEGTRYGLDGSLQRLREQQQRLQQEWHEHSENLKHRRQQNVALEKRHQQAQHLAQIAQQHQAWAALNQALRGEMQEASWRLLRLQLESGRLELQGWSRDFESLSAARQTLMGHLQSHIPHAQPASEMPSDLVRQTRVSTRGGGAAGASEGMDLEFVWVTAWPALQAASIPAPSQAKGGRP